MLLKSGEKKLTKKLICHYNASHYSAYNSSRYWEINISGPDTFECKEIIKAAGYKWIKDRKVWALHVPEKYILKTEIEKQKTYEINYYHNLGLTYPYCKPKCINKNCNEQKSSLNNENKCFKCIHKEECVGGLKCKGWMDISCKYNGLTVEGFKSCVQCINDSDEWVEQGKILNGNSGWFGNDRS